MRLHYDSHHWNAQFDNLLDMERWVSDTPQKWSYTDSVRNAPSRSWDLGVGMAGAKRLMRDGWEDGVKQLHALAATVPNNVIVTRQYGTAGELPDVPRYLAGDPLNMVHRGKTKVPKPTMTIVVSIGASCMVDAQEMWNFGAALTALVDRLESRRVRVELMGAWVSLLQVRFCASWHIKRAEDHLDLSAVAFSLAHPAMLRRIGFTVMERMPQQYQQPGYGRPTSDMRRTDFVDLPEGALLIGGIGTSGGQCSTMAGALAYAKASINKAYRELGHDGDIVELEEDDV